jgi:hypothetical protein
VSAEEDLEKAYQAFEGNDFTTAGRLFYEVFQSPEAGSDSELKQEMAWNLGLTCALQDDLNGSREWFLASGYGPEKFAEEQLDDFYQQVILGGQ